MDSLPNALGEAMLRVLEIDCHPARAEAQRERRIQFLRDARSILYEWSGGRVDEDGAIERIQALIARNRSS